MKNNCPPVQKVLGNFMDIYIMESDEQILSFGKMPEDPGPNDKTIYKYYSILLYVEKTEDTASATWKKA